MAAAYGEAERYMAAGTPDAVQGAMLIYGYAWEAGSGPSATAIGRMYDPDTFDAKKSAFPAPDAEKALLWYQRAAEKSDPEGLYRLGKLLLSGRIEQPGLGPEQGVRDLELAAQLGYAAAKTELGKLNKSQ